MNTTQSYWLDLFTVETWQEFLAAGGKVSGFRQSRWNAVQKMAAGDYLLCYLVRASWFIGVLEVAGAAFRDSTRIWAQDEFPCRVEVRPVVVLELDTAVPIRSLEGELSFFRDTSSAVGWTGHVRGSPSIWEAGDGEAVVRALYEAQEHPVSRPVDVKKLARGPKGVRGKEVGLVTIPEEEQEDGSTVEPAQASAHDEIQWLLLHLGNDMGLDVWVARNDRGKEVNGRRFADLSRLRKELPRQFDEATTRTIELIDVLWLKGNSIVAAFEIESTTSIYSGLLRMSDLLAMQPNLNIPLYLVAPDERRDKVIAEVNRPTFSRLSPSLSDVCRYIPFSGLREGVARVDPVIRFLKAEFIGELSEGCSLEEV